MKITKRKEGEGHFGPRYRVLIDGVATPLYVEKDAPPKYRMPQEWDVVHDAMPNHALVTSHSLTGALHTLGTLASVFSDFGGRP